MDIFDKPPYIKQIVNDRNKVWDWNKAQGYEFAGDFFPRRDINCRRISIENSGTNPIKCAVMLYQFGPIPPVQLTLDGGEVRYFGINPPDEESQFLWLLDIQSEKPVATPYILANNGQQFVIREGINKWWVQKFHKATFRTK